MGNLDLTLTGEDLKAALRAAKPAAPAAAAAGDSAHQAPDSKITIDQKYQVRAARLGGGVVRWWGAFGLLRETLRGQPERLGKG